MCGVNSRWLGKVRRAKAGGGAPRYTEDIVLKVLPKFHEWTGWHNGARVRKVKR